MDGNKLLENLKDIYLPERVSSWPLAYGWWILLGLLVVFVLIIFMILRSRKNNRKRKEAVIQDFRKEVVSISRQKPAEFLSYISVYLKRVAIQKFPKDSIKTLHGQEWLDFLDSKVKQDIFRNGVGKELADSYKICTLNASEQEELLELAEKWLRAVL